VHSADYSSADKGTSRFIYSGCSLCIPPLCIPAGEKTWEIRSKPNKRIGRIALCRKKGPIVGTAMIGPSIALKRSEFRSG
jgi:hypothetical protein